MKFYKTKLIISLIATPLLFALGCMPFATTPIGDMQTFSATTKTPLATVFGNSNISWDNLDTSPTDEEVISFLGSKITNNTYQDVTDQIEVASNSGGSAVVDAKPTSRNYEGSVTVNYTFASKTPLDTIVANNSDLGTISGWTSQPTNKDFLAELKLQFPNLDINQVKVDVANDATYVSALQYRLLITPISNSNIYSGSTTVLYSLTDARPTLSTDFTIGLTAADAFQWTYEPNPFNIESILDRICSRNSVLTNRISSYPYNITMDTTNKTVLLTVSDNPYYQDGSLTFHYQIVTVSPFVWTWDQITDPSLGNGSGWSSSGTSVTGGIVFIPQDITQHTVYIMDAYIYTLHPAEVTTTLSGSDIVLGTTISDSSGQQWTVTGLAGNGDVNTTNFGNDTGAFKNDTNIQGSFTLGNSVRYLGKNALRGAANITSLNLNEGLQTIYRHSCLTIGDTSLETIRIPSSVSGLGDYMFAEASLKNIYIYNSHHVYPGVVNTYGVFYGTASRYLSDSRTGRIYVPDNLLNSYINDPTWQTAVNDPGSTTGTTQVFRPIAKLSDHLSPSINLPPYATVETMLTLLCAFNNIDPSHIHDYKYTVTGYLTLGGGDTIMTISVMDNPYYYGSADIYWTKNQYNSFSLTYDQLNANAGWGGYTAGAMYFYIIDEVNHIVEFLQGSNAAGSGSNLQGENISIGNTITFQGVTYQVFGSYSPAGENNGLRNGTFSGSMTIGNQIKLLDRCTFRSLTNITSCIFQPESSVVEIGPCATMDMTQVTSWDIPASVVTIRYGNFGSGHANLAGASSITFRANHMYPYQVDGYTLFYYNTNLTSHILRIYVQPSLVNRYRNDPGWQTACGGYNYATQMILPITI